MIFGVAHHIEIIEVRETGDPCCPQEPVLDPHQLYEDLQKLYPADEYLTVEVPGSPGRYTLVIYPFAC